MKKPYTPEQKAQILAQIQSSNMSIKAAHEYFGIAASTLRTWIKLRQQDPKAGQSPEPAPAAPVDYIKQLEKLTVHFDTQFRTLQEMCEKQYRQLSRRLELLEPQREYHEPQQVSKIFGKAK